MVRALQDGLRARERRVRVDELGRRVDRAAHLASVPVLVFRMAVRTFALDVAVGKEHPFDRVIELLDGLTIDEIGFLQPPIDVLRQRHILRRVGRVPVIEADMKAAQVLRPSRRDARHQLLGADPFALRLEHDRRAVRIIGAYEMHLVPQHALKAHPDIALDVLHNVPDVKRAIGVGESGGDEEFSSHGDSLQGSPEAKQPGGG